ncbi:MAG TPA: hypothetical protein DCM73_10485 [Clostridiales bacterium]|nr:hypothetical protein [Clostridiales bacterium]
MKKEQLIGIENYMRSCMADSAHDKEHIYRVLYTALDIAQYENNVNIDVLVTACLLHDIGRQEQFDNPELCHAKVGGEKAYHFLIRNKFDEKFASKVKDCIKTHRYRADEPPCSLEAKILFDADKIDVTGVIGIARTILYEGHIGEPLYSLLPDGQVSDGTNDSTPSFFQEYKYKLENLYDKFYTKRATCIAKARQASAASFYKNIVEEVSFSYSDGQKLLDNYIHS